MRCRTKTDQGLRLFGPDAEPSEMPFAPPRHSNPAQQQQRLIADKQHNSDTAFYHSATWKKLRKLILARDPLCVICLAAGQVTEATQVDHIVPRRIAPDRSYDSTNLRSICASCHSRRTRQDQLGQVTT